MTTLRQTLPVSVLAATVFVGPTANGAGVADGAAESGSIGAERSVSEPRNGRIAFMSSPADWEIFSIRSNGLDRQRLTFDQDHDQINPAWSPSGTQIAYAQQRDDYHYDLYIMDADGSNAHAVTNDAASQTNPTWSPSGQRLAFVGDSSAGRDLFTIRTDGSELRQLTNGLRVGNPDWSPTGNRIVFDVDGPSDDDRADLYTIKPDGSDLQQITHSPSRDDVDASFSPSGKRIAYSLCLGHADCLIAVKPVAGGEHRLLARNNARTYGSPTWSPNGRRIAYVQASGSGGSADVDLFSKRPNGNDRRRITHTPRFIEGGADWGLAPVTP